MEDVTIIKMASESMQQPTTIMDKMQTTKLVE
jgi:hypothetical protein